MARKTRLELDVVGTCAGGPVSHTVGCAAGEPTAFEAETANDGGHNLQAATFIKACAGRGPPTPSFSLPPVQIRRHDRFETAVVGYLRRRTGDVELAIDLAG